MNYEAQKQAQEAVKPVYWAAEDIAVRLYPGDSANRYIRAGRKFVVEKAFVHMLLSGSTVEWIEKTLLDYLMKEPVYQRLAEHAGGIVRWHRFRQERPEVDIGDTFCDVHRCEFGTWIKVILAPDAVVLFASLLDGKPETLALMDSWSDGIRYPSTQEEHDAFLSFAEHALSLESQTPAKP